MTGSIQSTKAMTECRETWTKSPKFVTLIRALQQRLPNNKIFKLFDDALAASASMASFQEHFVAAWKSLHDPPVDQAVLDILQRHILKRFDQINDTANYALNDEFLEIFLAGVKDNLQMTFDSDRIVHRFYPTSDDGRSYIHIRAKDALVSSGTTGFSLWEASIALLELCRTVPELARTLFHNRRILELGSGTGLGGLGVAACCSPASVTFTDTDQVLTQFTESNISLNSALLSKAVFLQCVALDWNDFQAETLQLAQCNDLVIGCDLIYDPSIYQLLLKTLQSLFSAPKSSITEALLICTQRNPQTYHDFVNEAQKLFILHQQKFSEIHKNDSGVILQNPDSLYLVFLSRKN